jgi:hypothetical protein
MKLDEKVNEVAIGFELRYGTAELIKVALSALNRILVEKGVATEEEIQLMFLKEMGSKL